MAKTKLFEAWSFRLQQPAPFDDPKYAGSKSMGFSQYNTSSTAQKSTLHAPTMRALLAYAKLVSATENGQSVDGLGAIGHQGTTYRISEYRSANKTDCVVFNPVTGKFNAAQVEDGTQALKPYSVGAGNGTGSGLLFCLMPVLNEDDEFRQKFQEFVSLLESGWADMDAAFECALTLCDNVYRRIENSKQLGSDGVKISIPTTGNISVITQMAMDSGNYAPTGASYGEFTIMQMSGTPTAKASSFQKEDFVAKYALSNRILTARELAMVPTLPDWYIIPKEVVRVCEHAKVTTASSQPIYDMEAPDLNTMVKRVMNVTGFTDEQEATKMAIVVRDVAERCRQTMITDGSCGMREFKSWVLSTMVTHDPYESALSTIISSASADPDNRAELISACLERQYTRTI